MRGRHLVKRSLPFAAVLLATSIAATPAGATAAAKKKQPEITVLVTNDDGIAAPGIDAIVETLRTQKGTKVVVVAPAENQSGAGSKSTPGGAPGAPGTTASGYAGHAVTGYPADSVNYAFDVLKVQPNVVISGSNSGQNMGFIADEVSGTVGAARQAARRGIPALAVSSQLGDNPDFATSAAMAVAWLKEHRAALAKQKAKVDGTALTQIDNLNVPTCPGGAKGPVDSVLAPKDSTDSLLSTTPDCASTLTKFTSDAQAFNNGWASITQVTVPATAG